MKVRGVEIQIKIYLLKNKIKLYLSDIINSHKTQGKWRILSGNKIVVVVTFERQTGIKLRRWGINLLINAFIRVNFVNPTINKYFNTTLYMNKCF